ncbi:Nodule Cysteine-Rich (NCR) secreted peptide [Medicago truncatula]|uniref:Nodule Cysteine-Rich (NCR) secreted peptide n=1 Tax=Medicago truncatula TaxID=3880 RepID=A7KHF7_MEDTR|nr:nodule-specific cysteine-rich peptide 327 [Medicago truncatula]KEH23242.1 Nodule Cysteine-Rich (NCR) secreted peptide [Medicago truncatula]
MATILMYVYITILFISILTVLTEGLYEPLYNFRRDPDCRRNIDCPSYLCVAPKVPRCIMFECHCKDIPSDH